MPPRKSAPAALEGLSFEQAVAELEALVAEVEGGEVPLEKALAASERGAKLAAHCRSLLDRAESRLVELKESQGRLGPAVVDDAGQDMGQDAEEKA